MTRTTGFGIGAAVALAASGLLSDRRGSWGLPASTLIERAREAVTRARNAEMTASSTTAGQRGQAATPSAERQIAPSDDMTSIVATGSDAAFPDPRDYDSLDNALARLEDALADYAVWSLDFLLDLDLDLDLAATDEVQTASPAGAPEPTSEARNAPAPPRERSSAPAVITRVPQPARIPAGFDSAPAWQVAALPAPAEASPDVTIESDHGTPSTARSDRPRRTPDAVTPSPGAVFPAGASPAADDRPGSPPAFDPPAGSAVRPAMRGRARDDETCDDDDACTLDRRLGNACHHERIPGSVTVCALRGLVVVRQRLLDGAPPTAFADPASGTRVRARLGRALRSIDRALTRADQAKRRGGPERSGTVARHFAAYEARVRSRPIERDLIDPDLIRALHMPAGALAPAP